MPGWIESRIQLVEQRVEMLYRRLVGDEQQIKAAAQTATAAFQSGGGGGGGGGGVPYFFSPTAALAGASGPPSSGTPTSLANQSLYAISGGAFALVTSTATVYNGMQSGLVITKTTICIANADGTYSAITQSCT